MKHELSNLKNLKLLMWLRSIAIAGQAIAIMVVTRTLEIPLTEKPLWMIIGILILVNIGTFWRVKNASNIGQGEFLTQLLIDITALFALLYYTGGATNPFATLFILQVIIAAVVLRPLYTWLIAVLAVALYTLLMFWNVEVPYFLHHHVGDFFNLHVQGMWISFILLAGIVAWFIVRMNQTIYRQNTLLSEAETIAALGSLAANAAHELGTPLATMAVLSESLDGEIRQKFSGHITRCKEIISRIAASSGVNRAEGGSKMTLKAFLQEIATEWRNNHPIINLQATFQGDGNPSIVAEASLKHALFNVLDNAFDASPENIAFEAKWTAQKLSIFIRDKGQGISAEIKDTIGEAGVTTKTNGLGLGLFLTKSVVTRLEGELIVANSKDGGAICSITMPLRRLAV